MRNNIKLAALEVKEIEDCGNTYRIVLKDSSKESSVFQATMSKIVPLTLKNNSTTQINVIGKVPAEEANQYSDIVHPFGLPAKEVEGEEDVLSDSTGDPYTELQSVLLDSEAVVCPVQIGDLLIVEVGQNSRNTLLS